MKKELVYRLNAITNNMIEYSKIDETMADINKIAAEYGVKLKIDTIGNGYASYLIYRQISPKIVKVRRARAKIKDIIPDKRFNMFDHCRFDVKTLLASTDLKNRRYK